MKSQTYQQWSMTLRGMGTLAGENLARLRASRFLTAMMINLYLRASSPHEATPDLLKEIPVQMAQDQTKLALAIGKPPSRLLG